MIVGTNVYQTAARMGGIEGSKDKISTRNYLESVRNITELGFKQVELLLDPLKVALSEKELNNLMAELFKYKENTGVKYSVHLPFWWINIASPEKEIRKSIG